MRRHLVRPSVREGYDRWAESYDDTPNPLVALDRRVSLPALAPRQGEAVLDAGCGTGAYLARLAAARTRAFGLDFSRGMLHRARRAAPGAALAQADLNRPLPLRPGTFDAALCCLVSEHLTDLGTFFRETFAALRRGGRLVFSAFHPLMAQAGVEANFERDGVEYRLGAERHTTDDYLGHIADAGFVRLDCREYRGDHELARAVPGSAKYLGRPLLLLFSAERPA